MGSYLKIKKSKFIVTFLLIFNQLIISSYALENKEIVTIESEYHKSKSKYKEKFEVLISSKKQNKNNFKKEEAEEIDKFAEELEKFVEETFDPNNINNLKNQQENKNITNNKLNSTSEKSINNEIKNNKTNQRKTNQTKIDKLLLPSRSIISSSEFKVPPRGYVELSGPKISLNLKEADSIETLKLIAKLGDY